MSTLSEVARRAGVSLATASRALNGASGRTVRPELAERVHRAAEELNYIPNGGAQAMARGVSNVICLVVNDITDPYFGAVAAGVGRYATEHHLMMTIISSGSGAAERAAALRALTAQRVRGVIIAGAPTSDDPHMAELQRTISTLLANGTTVVTIGSPELGVPSVLVPNDEGVADLARALLDEGHRSFAVLAGPKDHAAARIRTRAFTRTVEEGGGRVITTLEGGFDRVSAMESVHRLVGAGRLPDVIFATNDLQILGALRGLRSARLRVPDDVGLAAFGDSDALGDASPSISTVSVDAVRAGELAAQLVLDPDAEIDPAVPYRINLRESTTRAR